MRVQDAEGNWINSSDNPHSRFFDDDRVFDLDALNNWPEMELKILWPGGPAEPSPMSYRVRKVLDLLKPQHRQVLEQHYFEGLSLSKIAKKRKVTEAAVRGMIKRAKENFIKAWAENAAQFKDVPEDEK